MTISHERLESLNRVLGNSRFLPQTIPAEKAWAALTVAIEQLSDAGEDLVVPQPNEQDAWRRSWEIYTKLHERQRAREAADPVKILASQQAHAAQELWDSFVSHREALIWEVKHGGLSPVLMEYVGLSPDDLETPDNKETEQWGGRFSGWKIRAHTLSIAIARWKSMSPDEKRLAPLVVTMRRQARAIEALERRVAALEGFSQKDAAA